MGGVGEEEGEENDERGKIMVFNTHHLQCVVFMRGKANTKLEKIARFMFIKSTL